MHLLIMRHGETTGDLHNQIGGTYNDQLTESGHHQAAQATKIIQKTGINFTHIYSSSLIRAQQTAQIINRELQIPLIIDHRIREKNHYSFLSGLPKDEAKKRYPDLYTKTQQGPQTTIIGAENYETFSKRIREYFQETIDRRQNTITVTHGGVIRYIIREILGAGECSHVHDCAILHLTYHDTQRHIHQLDGLTLTS